METAMKKKIYRFSVLLLALLTLSSTFLPALADEGETAPVINARAAVLMDAGSGSVLYASGENTPLYAGGLTMMMTALLAAETVERGEAQYEDLVTVSGSAYADVTADASTQGLTAGEELSLLNLLYCGLVGGATEAGNVIAEYIGGSRSAFLAQMNQRARELGCTNTSFANTHGLSNESNYSTAMDMARIAAAFVSHPQLMEIANTVAYKVPATNLHEARTLSSSNYILRTDYTRYYYSYACGIKSSYTEEAGYCLASSIKAGDHYVVSIVLGCQKVEDPSGFQDIPSFMETKKLMQWFNSLYSLRTVVDPMEPIAEVPIAKGDGTDSVVVCSDTALELFLPNKLDMDAAYTRSIRIFSQEAGETLTAPLSRGQVLGELTVTAADGTVYGPYSLVANTDVPISRLELMRQRVEETTQQSWFRLCFWGLIALLVLYFTYVTLYRVRRAKERKRAREARLAARRRDEES